MVNLVDHSPSRSRARDEDAARQGGRPSLSERVKTEVIGAPVSPVAAYWCPGRVRTTRV